MNQGVSPVFIDWVTAVGTLAKQGTWMRSMLDKEHTVPIRGAFHQTHGVEYYPSGMRHYYTPHNTLGESILVATGECLRNIRRDNSNDYATKVVAQLSRACHHFSRIDISVDIFDKGRTAWKLHDIVAQGTDMFGRRKVRLVRGGDMSAGCTVYVGSRSSPKMLRVYDKNAETKGEVPATRVEFELKSTASEQVSRLLSQDFGWLRATGLFNGLLQEFADWSEFPAIENMLYGEIVVIETVERPRLLDKKEWLARQIAPTFLKEPNGYGGELWAWFKDMIEREL